MCNKFLAAYSTNKIISFPNSEMPTYAITSRWTTCTTHDIYMFIKDGMWHIFWKSRQSRHSWLGWENVTSDVQHIAAHMHKVEADIAMDAKICFNLLWSGPATDADAEVPPAAFNPRIDRCHWVQAVMRWEVAERCHTTFTCWECLRSNPSPCSGQTCSMLDAGC